MEAPNFLVQLPSGQIYGYWTKEVLLTDMLLNKEQGKVKTFEIDKKTLVLKYNPIDIE